MEDIRRLYEAKEKLLTVYKLKPDFDALEVAKREYIENANQEELLYQIISQKEPSWITDGIYVPINQLDDVGNLFRTKKETILTPMKRIPNTKRGLLDVYCKSDLGEGSELKIVYKDAEDEILHYFMFLSKHYTGKHDRLVHFDNILALSRELFMYELLLKGKYGYVDADALGEVGKYFSLEVLDEISMSTINSLDADIAGVIMGREQVTNRLVKKINGKI